jgi:hypothetical protein
MRFLFFVLVFIALIFSSNLIAQTLMGGLETNFRLSPQFLSHGQNEPSNVRHNESKVMVLAEFSEMKKLIFAIESSQYRFTLNEEFTHLKSMNFRLLYMFPLSEKLQLRMMAYPKFQSEKFNLTADYFLYDIAAMFSFTKSESYNWQTGLLVGKEFWGLKVNPYIGFVWNPIEELELQLDAPKFYLNYNVSEKIIIGMYAGGFTTSYAGANNTYYDEERVDVLATFEYRPVPFIRLKVRAGQSSRAYGLYDMDDQLNLKVMLTEIGERNALSEFSKAGLIFEAGITAFLFKKSFN